MGYLMAAGDAPAAWFKWSAAALGSVLSAEQSLQGMTDELISAWDQLELVCRVTQSLASTADLLAVLSSILSEVRRVLNAGNGFLVLEYEGDLKLCRLRPTPRFRRGNGNYITACSAQRG